MVKCQNGRQFNAELCVYKIETIAYSSNDVDSLLIIIFFYLGKAREKLKWADGKAIKAEIDMQVIQIIHVYSWITCTNNFG